MKIFEQSLGRVSIHPEGDWKANTKYEKLALVYCPESNLSYIAKKDVPAGIDITDENYWQVWGDGKAVHPNWNENNIESVDYIKNRTHWKVDDNVILVEIYDTSITINEQDVNANVFDLFQNIVPKFVKFYDSLVNLYGINKQPFLEVTFAYDSLGHDITQYIHFEGWGNSYEVLVNTDINSHEITSIGFRVKGEFACIDKNYTHTYIKLPVEYIPDSIARISAIVFERGSGVNSIKQKGTGAVASGPNAVAEGADNLQDEDAGEGEELLYSKAEGYASHAEGAANAIGHYSHAEGGGNSVVDGYKTVPTAEGAYSHAEGSHTYAKGSRSHAEGLLTQALGDGSHVEGYKTIGRNANDHAEGIETVAEGWSSHAEGELSEASAARSHTEGYNTKTGGSDTTNSRTAGNITKGYSHAEGNASIANGQAAHAEGTKTLASNHSSHAEGNNTIASGLQAHAEGLSTTALGPRSHAEGNGSQATGSFSHAENRTTIAQGHSSHAEGYQTVAGIDAKQEANNDITDGYFTHAEGNGTRAYGNSSHAEGKDTQANGLASHAEGGETSANKDYCHAEGYKTKANGLISHAEGRETQALGDYSHAEGYKTIAFNNYCHAEGKYNYPGVNTIHSVGIGTSEDTRKNAITITENGEIYIIGVGGYNGINAMSKINSLQKVLENLGVTIDWNVLN